MGIFHARAHCNLRRQRHDRNAWWIVAIALAFLGGDLSRADPRSTDTAVSAMIQQVADSRRLYQRALARQDAAMLAIAAELRAEALGTWQPTGNADGGIPTPHDMLEQARQWASHDDALGVVVDRIGQRRHRGNINGPLVRHVTIDSRRPFSIDTAFTPKFPAVVYLEGVPNARFAVRILDPDGAPVCEDASARTYKLCRFLPDRSEPYSVEATSSDAAPLELLIITN